MTAQLPSHAQAVVIGGGVIGTSVAYHLTKLGMHDVVVLERGRLTSGTSWHAAGLIMQLRSTHSMTDLSRRNAVCYAGLEADTGQDIGFKQNGTLAVARTRDRLFEIKRVASTARSFGIEAQVIGSSEVKGLYPAIDARLVEGGLFIPKDGQLNPVDTVMAFAAGARKRGARIFEQTPVIDLEQLPSSHYRVRTAAGAVECEQLVLACGLWTRDLAASLGVRVPLYACEHFYVVTEPLDLATSDLPVLRDTDGYVYLKEDAGKILVGAFEPDAKPLPMANLPADHEFIELQEDWDHFALPYGKAAEIVPALKQVGISKFLNGPESPTFLGRVIVPIGLVVGVRVLRGDLCRREPERTLPAERLAETGAAGREAVVHRALPHGARSFPLPIGPVHVIDGAERLARAVAQIPLVDLEGVEPSDIDVGNIHRGLASDDPLGQRDPGTGRHLEPFRIEAGGNIAARPPWCLADDEGGIGRKAVRQNVAVFEQSSFGKHLVQGSDSCAALQRLCANDVDVAPGRIVYTHMLNARGGIEADLTVTRLATDRYLVVSSAAFQARDRAWMERHIDSRAHVFLTDVTSAYAVLSIQGPNSRALLQALTDEDLSAEAFPFATSREIDIGYARVIANRLTFVGELGWEFYIPTEFAIDVYDRIIEAGAAFGLQHAGYHALEHLRSERGYREFSLDLTPDDTPYEAGLGFAVKLDKPGGFIGREAVAAQKGRKLTKRLVMFKLRDKEPDLHRGELIRLDGEIVGYLRSGAYGFTVGGAVGMGYVSHPDGVDQALLDGGSFEIEIACERFAAEASLQAFYDPRGERTRH